MAARQVEMDAGRWRNARRYRHRKKCRMRPTNLAKPGTDFRGKVPGLVWARQIGDPTR